jgi:hypothetical protein
MHLNKISHPGIFKNEICQLVLVYDKNINVLIYDLWSSFNILTHTANIIKIEKYYLI